MKREEREEIFNNDFLDREQAEVVSLTESRLLDVDRGRVLPYRIVKYPDRFGQNHRGGG